MLPFFDFFTVVDWDDMEKGVEYIRAKVLDLEDKSIKMCEKRLFEEYLDCYFKSMDEEKLVEMFNYKQSDNWKRDM